LRRVTPAGCVTELFISAIMVGPPPEPCRGEMKLKGGDMKNSLAIGALVLLLSGSVADTMRGYVGQDIRAVELAYGPPLNQIDLGNGTRAFQWNKVSVDTTPMTAVTSTDKDKKGRRKEQTQFVGGSQSVTNCLYTFLAVWDKKRNGWIVTGFRQPSLDCAIGSLD
jgi:hypothetical protein